MKTLRLVKVYDDWTDRTHIGIYEVTLNDELVPFSRSTLPIRFQWDAEDEENSVEFLMMIQKALKQSVLNDEDLIEELPF